jgi:O-antigen/teichoic acid export membrane protein
MPDVAEPPEPAVPAHRAPPGELVSGVFALALLILMFAAEWFGINRLPGEASGVQRSTAENAWHALPVLRWLMLVTAIVAIGAVLLNASQQMHGARNDTGALVTVLGGLTAVLLAYRVLIDLPDAKQVVDQKVGAVLGMLCAFGIALGGYRTRSEERTQTEWKPRITRRKPGVEHVGGPR